MSKLVRPPSPAMLVALLALCVALGGTVYAADQINGKEIKKGSEPGNRLKKDTVTGKQVRESSLETVPDAANANTLQGQGPDAFAPSGLEAAHVVGAPGQPYTNGWTEPTASVDAASVLQGPLRNRPPSGKRLSLRPFRGLRVHTAARLPARGVPLLHRLRKWGRCARISRRLQTARLELSSEQERAS